MSLMCPGISLSTLVHDFHLYDPDMTFQKTCPDVVIKAAFGKVCNEMYLCSQISTDHGDGWILGARSWEPYLTGEIEEIQRNTDKSQEVHNWEILKSFIIHSRHKAGREIRVSWEGDITLSGALADISVKKDVKCTEDETRRGYRCTHSVQEQEPTF